MKNNQKNNEKITIISVLSPPSLRSSCTSPLSSCSVSKSSCGFSTFRIELLSNLPASFTYAGVMVSEQWTLANASDNLISDSNCLTVIRYAVFCCDASLTRNLTYSAFSVSAASFDIWGLRSFANLR